MRGRVAHVSLFERVILYPSGRTVRIDGANEDGQLGAPPAHWVADGSLELPERCASVHRSPAGIVCVGASGTVFATGGARPGDAWAIGPVALPADVVQLSVSDLVCAVVGGGEPHCWPSWQRPPHPRDDEPQPLPDAPADIVQLASNGPRLCARTRMGELHCWEVDSNSNRPRGAPRQIARGVETIAGYAPVLCYVEGESRELRCWWANEAEPAAVGLRDVASLDTSEGTICAVATSSYRNAPWLYCWGYSFLRGGWLNVGPNGVSPDSVASEEPDLPNLPRPRPVLPVRYSTRVELLGLLVCLSDPGDEPTRCDPLVDTTPLPSLYRVERLPLSRRPYPGREALLRERFVD